MASPEQHSVLARFGMLTANTFYHDFNTLQPRVSTRAPWWNWTTSRGGNSNATLHHATKQEEIPLIHHALPFLDTVFSIWQLSFQSSSSSANRPCRFAPVFLSETVAANSQNSRPKTVTMPWFQMPAFIYEAAKWNSLRMHAHSCFTADCEFAARDGCLSIFVGSWWYHQHLSVYT